MLRNSGEFQALMRVHANLPRQGPGSDEMTARALSLLPKLKSGAVIYDLGCGPGRSALVLARLLSLKVVAVDLSIRFLAQLSEQAAEQGLSDLIETRCGDIAEIDAEPQSIDLIWSEGAIYCVGFDKGLRLWRPFLAEGGLIAFTELSWLSPVPSLQAVEFWQANYPAMRAQADNIAAAEGLGYRILHNFTLPLSCWFDQYYDPLSRNIDSLSLEAEHDQVLASAIANTKAEIDLFRLCNADYGYVFYLLEKA